MFWMNNKTYYLYMDANNPTDNSSQTENNVNTAIKNFNIETSQNAFKFYFPPRNKLHYKNLLTLVKRLSVWFDHIMMSLIWCFDNFRWSKYPITESLKEEEKLLSCSTLTVTGFSQQVALENLRPHNCCDPIGFCIQWSNFLYRQNNIDQNW